MRQEKSSAELRAMAREQLLGKYRQLSGYVVLILLINFFIGNLLFAIQTSGLWFSIAGSLVQALFTDIFIVGFMRVCVQLSRGQNVTISDMFYVIKHDPDKVIVISFILWLGQVVVQLPLLISFGANEGTTQTTFIRTASVILLVIAYAYVYIVLSQCYFIYLDNPSYGIVDILNKSMEMMQNRKLRFFKLLISIAGMLIMIFITLGIGVFWLLPYMYFTLFNFYEDVKGETDGYSIEIEG